MQINKTAPLIYLFAEKCVFLKLLSVLQENHEYLVRIFARNEVGLSDPLESDEPFLVKKPTGELTFNTYKIYL